MSNIELFNELKPQYLEVVCQERERDWALDNLKKYLIAEIGGKLIIDIPLEKLTDLKSEIAEIVSRKMYIGLGFLHSGDGVYVTDESGENITPYPRGKDQIWVRKKLMIVCPQGDRFYITGWEFVPGEPFVQNTLILSYKIGSVPCNVRCFQSERKE